MSSDRSQTDNMDRSESATSTKIQVLEVQEAEVTNTKYAGVDNHNKVAPSDAKQSTQTNVGEDKRSRYT